LEKKFFYSITILLLICSLLQAGPNLLLDTSSVRGLGLAGCFTAIDEDVEAITVNPAGLASLRNKEISLGYLSWFEDVEFYSLTSGMPLSKNIGVGALNITLFSVKDFPNYDENGNQLANLDASDFLIIFGLGKKFNISQITKLIKVFTAGANLKIFSTTLGEESSSSFAFDLGMQSKFTFPALSGNKLIDNLTIGLAFQNLGSGQTYIKESSDLPTKLRIGGNYKFYQKKDKIDSSILLEFNKTTRQEFKVAFGVETGLYNLFKVRFGYKLISKNYAKISIGFSASYNISNCKLKVDYTMIPSADFGLTNTFGLKFIF